jgi:hypothetical protein
LELDEIESSDNEEKKITESSGVSIRHDERLNETNVDNIEEDEVKEDINETAIDETKWETVTSNKKNKNSNRPKQNLTAAAKPPSKSVATLTNDEYNKENVKLVKSLCDKRIKCLIILRGCSGSGKSTLANQIKFNGVICSADDYFTDSNGVYTFDASKLEDAHNDCRVKAENAMVNHLTPVIIDNTNLKIWEFKQYVQMVICVYSI